MEKFYNYLEEEIKKRKRQGIMGLFSYVLFSIIVSLVVISVEDINATSFFPIMLRFTISILLFAVVTIVIFNFITFKNLRNTQIILSENRIVRRGQKNIESIRFDNLTKVKVTKNPSGKIEAIELASPNYSFNIMGFQHMDEIVEGIREKLDDSSILVIKNRKLDWNSSIVDICSFVFLAAIFSILIIFDLNITNFLVNIIFAVGGIWFIISRPLSKNIGKNFLVFEIILGAIILYISLKEIILSLIL